VDGSPAHGHGGQTYGDIRGPGRARTDDHRGV